MGVSKAKDDIKRMKRKATPIYLEDVYNLYLNLIAIKSLKRVKQPTSPKGRKEGKKEGRRRKEKR